MPDGTARPSTATLPTRLRTRPSGPTSSSAARRPAILQAFLVPTTKRRYDGAAGGAAGAIYSRGEEEQGRERARDRALAYLGGQGGGLRGGSRGEGVHATTPSPDPFRFPRPIRSAALVRFGLDFDDGAAHARAALAVVVVHRKLGLAPDDANHEDETAPSEYAGAAPAHTLGAGATPAGPSALSEAAVPAEGEAEARPQPRKRHQKRLRRQSGNARKASKGPGRAEGSP